MRKISDLEDKSEEHIQKEAWRGGGRGEGLYGGWGQGESPTSVQPGPQKESRKNTGETMFEKEMAEPVT